MLSAVLVRAPRHIAASNAGAFSTSAATQIDISSLYSRLTSFRRKQPKTEVVDPTKVDDKKTSDDTLPQESRARKLTVLGRARSLEADWPHVRKFAEFSPWPTNHYRKDLTETQIDEALAPLRDENFASVATRFDAVKAVSHQLNVSVPDAILSTLSSVDGLRKHLLSVSRPFDERQPDAVYLDAKDFVGTNITISDLAKERREQRSRTQELVKTARAAQKKASDELLRQTREAST